MIIDLIVAITGVILYAMHAKEAELGLRIIKSIGSREQEETIAHHLYEVLRDFDSCNVSAIYSEAFFTPKMGQAIMNRLLKAAGHKIINVEEETK